MIARKINRIDGGVEAKPNISSVLNGDRCLEFNLGQVDAELTFCFTHIKTICVLSRQL